jgi:endonuclease YncB( thermonuclease family)
MAITYMSTERVIDGDTLSLTFSGVHPIFGDEVPCRVRGVNCYGLYDRNPQRSLIAVGVKAAVTAWWNGAGVRGVNVYGRDRYFRWDVDLNKDSIDLATWLIGNAMGEAYDVQGSSIEDPTDPPLNDSFTPIGAGLALAVIHRVVDGDTFIGDTNETEPLTRDRLPIRLDYCDAYSLTDPDPVKRAEAEDARDRLEELLAGASTIEIKNFRRDKYFRLRCQVKVDGASVSWTLYQEGLVHMDPANYPTWFLYL